MLQVPSCILAGSVADGRRVVHLAVDQHEARALGDGEHIAGAQLDVGGGILPALDVCADADDQASGHRLFAQRREHVLFLLRHSLQQSGTIGASLAGRQFRAAALHLDPAHQLLPALFLQLAHLRTLQEGALGIGFRAEAASLP